MASVKLPHFGVLNPSSLEAYYDVDIDFNNTEVQVDLNFENATIDVKRLEITKHFIENIRIHDLNNRKYIQDDFNDEEGDTVRSYLEHHLEELATDDLNELVGPAAKTADQSKLLLKKLRLLRVGLYPDSVDQFAIFDYSIGKELTNYLVVINTDENGNLDYMTMES
ncbi:MAG TPA: DUF2004 domain-containing protein [Ferruginibacter sp.]|nr:DUF2004 domain-containing protein [Ferruginibacter sp.]